MADTTAIAWADRTHNEWEGCSKVGPGCDFCYAEDRDNRFHGGAHWGPGAPRRRTSEANRRKPHLWNKSADAFEAEHGHPQRIFLGSLGDWADNEVPAEWRADMWRTIRETDRLRWMTCTKRVTNTAKYLPADWSPQAYSHVGFLITCVTPEEAHRDVPKLIRLKKEYGFSWIGVSYEPALEWIVWKAEWLADGGLDWIICGGESGRNARDDNPSWYRGTLTACRLSGRTAFFQKQMAHLRPIPEDLMVRQFPQQLCQ